MQISVEGASVAIAVVALGVAVLTWLFPRSPKSRKIPLYTDTITKENGYKFGDFILENNNMIVNLNTLIPMEEEHIFTDVEKNADDSIQLLTVTNKELDGMPNGGFEISVHPHKDAKNGVIMFANGAYHLRGYFIVRVHPGIFQGYYGISITEIAPEQIVMSR